jgi:signal transduction histidine kinase/ligand-binding sensor domain-containing protein
MIKYYRPLFLYFFLFALQPALSAQPFNYSFEHFTTENGLSHESITCITKDRDGFLWIGTANGLNRFDGIAFNTFFNNKRDTSSLPGNYIAGTTLDKNGFLWVSTNYGICRMNTRTLEIKRINLAMPGDSLPRYEVMYGEFDRQGIGWFIVSGYLYAINHDNFQWQRFRLPTANFHGNAVQVDSKNRIWLSLGRAKYLFNPQTKKFRYLMGYDYDHTDSKVLCGWLQEDETGTLWMATWGHGFFTWNEMKQEFESREPVNESLTHFVFDKDENNNPYIWCGGGIYGLMAFDRNNKNLFQFKNDPRDEYTHNLGQATFIFLDTSSGIVWIGTENGLEKFDPHAIRFSRYRIWQNKDELSNTQYFFTSGFVQDKTDPTGNTWWVSVWIGGVYKWNRNKLKLESDYVETPGIKDHGVFSMIQARDGKIWVGHGLGVQVLDPAQNKFMKHLVDFFPDQSKRRTVTFITEDSKSNMWFATYQGLYSWERSGDSVINWSLKIPELKGVDPGHIREDAAGMIWISSAKGLYRIDPEKKQAVVYINKKRTGKKLPDDAIGAINIDHRQHIWVSGVSYIAELEPNGEVIKIYNGSNGFQATGVYNILEDPQHFIWIATDNKLHRLNSTTGHFDYFDKQDGLFNNKIGDGFYLSPQSELFIGFNGAINSIQTDKIAFNKKPPTVFVSQLNVNGKLRNFDVNNKITIKPGERNILIEFAALNYSQSKKNRFSYMLEGFDSTWKFTAERKIMLMNMEGGTHKLRVMASNNDGVWSDETVYTIRVIPPFQKTIWFRLLIVAFIVLIVLMVGWYRRQQRKRLEKIRNRIATDLHDDMGSTLSSIRIFSDVAKKQIEKDKPDTVQLLDRISQNATSLSENMQDIIWTIRSDNDTLEDLVFRMREFGLRVCDARNIQFNTKVSQNFKTSKLSLEQRRNLYLIFKESLNNAVKYACASQIDLLLNLHGHYLKMEVTDNGKGFNIEKIKRGNGLNNLEKRVKEINGQITISSSPGKGATISVMMKLKKNMLKEKKSN